MADFPPDEVTPTAQSEEEVCRGRRVSLRRLKISYGGSIFYADKVAFGSSVVVLPVLDDGRVLLIKQWRAAVGDWVIEAPAGRIEPGETPEKAAARELEEETGFRASRLERLYSAYVSPGYSDELQYAFVAHGLTPTRQSLEEDEVIRQAPMRPEDYLSLASSAHSDLKTMAVITLYLGYKSMSSPRRL